MNRRALGQPALHTLGAVVALIAFAWPFLVFDRPIQVFVCLFATWLAVIAVLFTLSFATEGEEGEPQADEEAIDG